MTGLKALGVRDLNYKLMFLCNYVQSCSNAFELNQRSRHAPYEGGDELDGEADFTISELQEIEMMQNSSELYAKLTRSIAPTVFGHEEIKKAILLMLFGGVQKKTKESAMLRGDINVMIVGDPATAKS